MIALAALSARAMAEWAAHDGTPAVALDVFGDADTRRAAAEWQSIAAEGAGQGPAIDGARLLAALRRLKARGDVSGWVAGSGFEAAGGLLVRAAEVLPLIGTAAHAVARLRDPKVFFAALERLRIAHPPTQFQAPAERAGWLAKDSRSCGGWRVVRGGRSGDHWQRELAGVPMSATFVANGRDVTLLGFNRQLVRACGERPFVHEGVVGPLPVGERLQARATEALRALVPTFELRGLGSLDFVVAEGEPWVVELNARPPASAALHPSIDGASPLRAHCLASEQGRLPAAPAPAGTVRGTLVVYARRTLRLDAAAAAALARRPGVHDLPHGGQSFDAGDPVCSLWAHGRDEAAVVAALTTQRDALLEAWETTR